MKRLLVFLLSFFATLAIAPRVFADEISAMVGLPIVEVGEPIPYVVTASSETEAPQAPQPGPTSGLTIESASASPAHMVSIINGRMTEKHQLMATWTLSAKKEGTYTLGPASMQIGGRRVQAKAVQVKVVAKGKGMFPGGHGRRPSQGSDPFGAGPSPMDIWKGLLDAPQTDDDDPRGRRDRDILGAVGNQELSLPVERGTSAFLHARIDKQRAVVGEQVTLSVYLYEDPRMRQGQPEDVHEATAPDFVKRPLQQDETRTIGLGATMVGGRPWVVKLVRRNALFPLKTGRLKIGPMTLSMPNVRMGKRESEELFVDVTEPPASGRPAGYQVGDVGDYSLSATVAPRQVEQDGAIGVTIELRGTGNLPQKLALPEIAGVEWLETDTKDQVGPVKEERFGGTRVFSYVARMHKDGAIALGEVRLPFFDPSTRVYNVARAGLGIVDVAKGAPKPDAGAETTPPVLPDLPKLRATFEGAKAESFVAERSWFWGGVFGAPFAAIVVISIQGASRRLREKRATASASPKKLAKDARTKAEAAIKGTDGGAALAAVTSAVEAEVLARTGINVRGTSRDEAQRELEEAGIAASATRELLDVLADCEDARFSPSGVDIDTAKELWSRAEAAVSRIGVA